MRIVFDQYTTQENQITHALLTALACEAGLAKAFLRWIGLKEAIGSPKILQQSLPGEMKVDDEAEAERRGLPDGVIYETDRYTVLIESKVASTPTLTQLKAHRATALRKGYAAPMVLLITIQQLSGPVDADWMKVIRWTDVYGWLKSRPAAFWTGQVTGFLESREAKWSADNYLREGTLTTFSGIPFGQDDERYSYDQAKRLIRLLRRELVERAEVRALGANTNSKGRAAITGRSEDRVWDFIPIQAKATEDNFTQNVHLTLGILDDRLEAYVTIPNGIRSRRRTKLLGGSLEAFSTVIRETTTNLVRVLRKEPNARPSIIVVQRYYSSQRAAAEHHALLQFDPRTFFATKGSKVKHQPQWLAATYESLAHRQSNLQFQVGMDFSYARCKQVRTTGIVDLVAEVWSACKPVIDAVSD